MELKHPQLENKLVHPAQGDLGEKSITRSSLESDLFKTILRVHEEPVKYFDEKRVHHLLTQRLDLYLAYLSKNLHEIAEGRMRLEMPPKQIFSDASEDGDFRIMPCVVHQGTTLRKTVKIVGTNLRPSISVTLQP